MTCGYFFILKINGVEVTLKGDGFRDRESADRAFAIALKDCSYRPPRWWQFHRWGGNSPAARSSSISSPRRLVDVMTSLPDSADHRLLLALAKDAFAHESGLAWKLDAYEASRAHGERCDRVWNELRRQLALRGEIDLPQIPAPIADQTLGIRRELKKRLIEALPELIEQAMGEF